MNTSVAELLFTDEEMPGCLDEQAYSEVSIRELNMI